MATFVLPTNASLHAIRAFISHNPDLFSTADGRARLVLHEKWMHLEPVALAMVASWGAWCRRTGLPLTVEGLSDRADYAWRMRLFEHLGVEYHPSRRENEEAGRFIPLANVRVAQDIPAVIANVSALLHLDGDLDSLRAVQHCISELLRNVVEHSSSPDGAFICAHNYTTQGRRRVTIGVADCGMGIAAHLVRAYPEARTDILALPLAMTPGITGAIPGLYGTPDNAGAGLFITRSIAKGTGGYFVLHSGKACYRLRRTTSDVAQSQLFPDPLADRHDLWSFDSAWQGTVVSLEIATERIADVDGYFQWIRDHLPARPGVRQRIRFR